MAARACRRSSTGPRRWRTAGYSSRCTSCWSPSGSQAPEPARTALQGLIQIAVAFHHLENGNREGARSLLILGVSKVAGAGSALPLETQGWLDELGATLAALAAGGAPAVIPRWPRPAAPQPGPTP